MYSKKATKFCKISSLDLSCHSCVVMVKSTVEISQNFVAFSEYMNFNKNEWRINYHLMDRYAAVAPDLARTIECQSAIWRALSVSRFRGSRFFSCQTLLIQGRDALDLVRPGKGHVSKREDHGGPITSLSHVFTNPESTKLELFPRNLSFALIWSKWIFI